MTRSISALMKVSKSSSTSQWRASKPLQRVFSLGEMLLLHFDHLHDFSQCRRVRLITARKRRATAVEPHFDDDDAALPARGRNSRKSRSLPSS